MKTALLSVVFVLVFAAAGLAQQTTSQMPAPTTEQQLATALQRLDKVLDAYEKAMLAIKSKDDVIEAMKIRDDLKNDLLKIKDQMIADVLADNAFLRKAATGTKSWVRKALEKIADAAKVAAAIYIGSKI